MSIVRSVSISEAWREAVAVAINSREREVISLVVNIECGQTQWPEEDLAFRAALNETLSAAQKSSVETVARTIFPNGLWNPELPRQVLYDRFFRILPKLRGCRKNRNGHYFERLINFPQARHSPKNLINWSILFRRTQRWVTIGGALYKRHWLIPFWMPNTLDNSDFPVFIRSHFYPTRVHAHCVLWRTILLITYLSGHTAIISGYFILGGSWQRR